MARNRRQRAIPRKPRPLRRSQLISPFGVGAISDFRGDESLMCAGLDAWFASDAQIPAYLRMEEARLQRRLGMQFFVRPPEHEGEDGQKRRIPFVRFPQWHYCPHCFRMKKATFYQDQPRCDVCNPQRKRQMIPVRIVAACDDGHLQDFPFRLWIKCTCEDEEHAELMFKAGRSSAGLGGIQISCQRCGKTQSLAGAMQPERLDRVGAKCSGSRPWFGQHSSSCCNGLKGLQRGGSNAYFPVVVSSIYVPDEQGGGDERILAVLENEAVWALLTSNREDGELDRGRSDMLAVSRGHDPDRLYALAQARLSGEDSNDAQPSSEEDFRQQEYALLRKSTASAELVSDWVDGYRYEELASFVRGVGLVRKLRETRVLCGFTRLEPQSDPADPRVQRLALSERIRWLPGIDVYGEGIFIEFRPEPLREWAARPSVRGRFEPALERFERIRSSRGQPGYGANSRLYFLHTFAHALIKELTFSCGYGSSSLRERLYFDAQHPEQPMAGVLIYTASGDADGTLGGLVAQGTPERLPRIVVEALRRAAWCSNDPVCMESHSRSGDTGNLAACHSCALVPETSCEHGNRLLDRAALVGTVRDPGVGLLSSLVPSAAGSGREGQGA